jgi:hypothetical protein
MAIFWDFRRIIFVDYVPRDQTITGKYYADLSFEYLYLQLSSKYTKLYNFN